MSIKSDTYTPILPFDITYGESFSIYKKMPYKLDKDLCSKEKIRKESGNVYKYYTLTESKPVIIGEINETKQEDAEYDDSQQE